MTHIFQRGWFNHQLDYSFSREFQSSKVGSNPILIVFDFQGIDKIEDVGENQKTCPDARLEEKKIGQCFVTLNKNIC